MLALVSMGTANSTWLLATVALIIVGSLVNHRSNDKRMTRLVYELSDSEVSKFNVTKQALISLRSAQMLWRIDTQNYTFDRKRNAGASSLIKRSTVRVGTLDIPRVEANVGIMGVDLGRIRLYFLPDLILYWQAGTFAAISFSDVRVTNGQTRFIEDGGGRKARTKNTSTSTVASSILFLSGPRYLFYARSVFDLAAVLLAVIL